MQINANIYLKLQMIRDADALDRGQILRQRNKEGIIF